jgi:Tfp pilus assembly protein PilO
MRQFGIKANSRNAIVFVVVAVLIFGGVVFGFVTMSEQLHSLDAELNDKQKKVDDAKQIARTLEESRLQYEDAQAQLHNMEASVSTQAYVPTLLKQVESLAKLVKLNVLSVRPVKEQPKPAPPPAKETDATAKDTPTKEAPKLYDELKINIDVEGKYVRALDFVYKLTSFPKIISVNSITLAPISAQEAALAGGSPNLRVSMNITAFVLKEAKQADSDAETKEDTGTTGASDHEADGGKS